MYSNRQYQVRGDYIEWGTGVTGHSVQVVREGDI